MIMQSSLVIFCLCYMTIVQLVKDIDIVAFDDSNQHNQVLYKDGLGSPYVDLLQETGHAINCGGHHFNLTWKPKVINPSEMITFWLNMTAANNLTFGNLKLALYAGGSKKPFITKQTSFLCNMIQIPEIKCPITEGDNISLTQTFNGVTSLPPGTYRLHVELNSTAYSPQKQFICANITVRILASGTPVE